MSQVKNKQEIKTEIKSNPFKKQIYPPQTQLFEASKTVDDGSSK